MALLDDTEKLTKPQQQLLHRFAQGRNIALPMYMFGPNDSIVDVGSAPACPPPETPHTTPTHDDEKGERTQSAIKGKGHGSSHTWVNKGTAQVGSYDPAKKTEYQCETCEERFTHRYAQIPDIFQAMKESGVTDRCLGDKASKNAASKMLPGWDEWAEWKALTKGKVLHAAFTMLSQYVATNSSTDLSRLTFRYLVEYLEKGTRSARLKVACADYGYALEELEAMRVAGKTGQALAAEVVARGEADC